MEEDIEINWEETPFSENRIVIPDCNQVNKVVTKQKLLREKPEYFGLKINEDDLAKHKTTIGEIIAKFKFEVYVIGRDERLSKKEKPHFHIHFKSCKSLASLQKKKQEVMPRWGKTCKIYPPRKNNDNWFCWAGYAIKEQEIFISDTVPETDRVEIRQYAKAMAMIKENKINWSKKQDDKKQEKKDLETRLYDALDMEFKLKAKVNPMDVAIKFGEVYLAEVGELPSGHHVDNKVWKWLYLRQIVTMRDYMGYKTSFGNFGSLKNPQFFSSEDI